ncbi:MAG: peptide chain release factor 3, partial [Actinomycetota bacterium]|nr:peptide chain release factor 3 [Actinomycetota bacterium]
VDLRETAYKMARRTDAATAQELRRLGGVKVLTRSDGELLALFENPYWLARLESDHPDWRLDHILVDPAVA